MTNNISSEDASPSLERLRLDVMHYYDHAFGIMTCTNTLTDLEQLSLIWVYISLLLMGIPCSYCFIYSVLHLVIDYQGLLYSLLPNSYFR